MAGAWKIGGSTAEHTRRNAFRPLKSRFSQRPIAAAFCRRGFVGLPIASSGPTMLAPRIGSTVQLKECLQLFNEAE
jgi:hypothetical protein